ncbi:hypothetical protein [Oleisolibacter albus]|uniref:hypothetical protein n=1 Tax=Oleisolibacter albus TaxID=2171757 RepID=UPI0012D72706|nr:hypothetical protein [Oleisolibacter albus]
MSSSGLDPVSFQIMANIGTIAGVIIAATAVLATSLLGLFSIQANHRNARMSVIMHCNIRYSELYKLKIELSGQNSDDEKVEYYFRQYWGLKSDQIDYWLAGYVDPETLISWYVSTIDALIDGKKVGRLSYSENWKTMEREHRFVNPTFCDIIRDIQAIYIEDSWQVRFAKMHVILEKYEEKERRIIKLLRRRHISFTNLYSTYGQGMKRCVDSAREKDNHR